MRGECFEDEEERSRIHAGNYIFQTDVAQLVITRNCKKKISAQNLGGGGLNPSLSEEKMIKSFRNLGQCSVKNGLLKKFVNLT